MTQIPDDLSIPACLDLRNADVAARRTRDRQAPVKAMPTINGHVRNLDAETQKFWEAEQERERIARENALAEFNAKRANKVAMLLNGRFDGRRNRWITPEEDFAHMAEQAKVSIEELRGHFEFVALHPDYPADGVKAFAKRILSQLDNGKLALEGEKMMERTKRRLKRKAMANACAAKPRRRVR